MNESEFTRLTCVSEHSRFTLRCNSVAWIDMREKRHPCILTLSAAGPVTAVKAVRAILCQSNVKAVFRLRSDDRSYGAELIRHGSYKTSVSTLAPGTAHLVVRAAIPGLLAENSEAALWRELTSDRYTTPLLRHWVPRISEWLTEEKLLVSSRGHNNQAAILEADTEDLDNIVSEGVTSGELTLA